jgi:hypothetical protein
MSQKHRHPVKKNKEKSSIYKILQNILLFFVALLVCLTALELCLRVIAPQYKYAAMAKQVTNRTRIYSNQPHASKNYKSPDSDHYHLVRFNSQGMRQSREFDKTKQEGVTRIAFLGDSYTANVRMPVGYSFTEPLDYLLNADAMPSEVLNFGVDGYGPDQEYLQLVDDVLPFKPDMVFYVYCKNDIRNVLENELFDLDASQNLIYKPYNKSFFKNISKELYLTYFTIDAIARLGIQGDNAILGTGNSLTNELKKNMFSNLNSNRYQEVEDDYIAGNKTPLVNKAEALFSILLNKMREACLASGAKFYVVLTPGDNQSVKATLSKEGIEYFDLNPEFEKFHATNTQSTRFANDLHWNEEGNKVAALSLYRFITKHLGRPGAQDAERHLGEYYGAFDDRRVSNAWLLDGDSAPAKREAIRLKYGLEPTADKQ